MKLVTVLQTCTVLYEALQEALLVFFYSRTPCLRNNITTFTALISASFKTCAYYCFRSVYYLISRKYYNSSAILYLLAQLFILGMYP